MYVTLISFTIIVLLPIAILFGVPVRRFAAAVAEPVSIAFATASSEAALPRAIEQMEKLGVSPETVASQIEVIVAAAVSVKPTSLVIRTAAW